MLHRCERVYGVVLPVGIGALGSEGGQSLETTAGLPQGSGVQSRQCLSRTARNLGPARLCGGGTRIPAWTQTRLERGQVELHGARTGGPRSLDGSGCIWPGWEGAVRDQCADLNRGGQGLIVNGWVNSRSLGAGSEYHKSMMQVRRRRCLTVGACGGGCFGCYVLVVGELFRFLSRSIGEFFFLFDSPAEPDCQ